MLFLPAVLTSCSLEPVADVDARTRRDLASGTDSSSPKPDSVSAGDGSASQDAGAEDASAIDVRQPPALDAGSDDAALAPDLGAGDAGSDAEAASGVDAGKNDGLGAGGDGVVKIGGCPLFTPDDEWNRDVSQLPVDPNWTQRFNQGWGQATITVVFGTDKTGLPGVPWQIVPENQPKLEVFFTYGWGKPPASAPGPYPFPGPDDVWIQQGDPACKRNTDCHILVVQQGTCRLYEAWACRWRNNRWECGAGNYVEMRKNSYGQVTSDEVFSEAANMPMLAGLIRYEEVASGEIKHALRFSSDCTSSRYIKPATHGADFGNACGVNPKPPLGLRIRLKASFDVSRYNKESQVVLRALKKYGALLGDNNPGGRGYNFQADVHEGWGKDQLYDLWKKIPNSAFEVVKTYQ